MLLGKKMFICYKDHIIYVCGVPYKWCINGDNNRINNSNVSDQKRKVRHHVVAGSGGLWFTMLQLA